MRHVIHRRANLYWSIVMIVHEPLPGVRISGYR